MSVIDEVKQRADIVEVISQYVRLTKAGRILRGLCPFHSEKTPSFFVYPEQQTWHCFGACGTGGDVFSFVMKKENIDFSAALRLLADRVGVTISKTSVREAEGKDRLYRINQAAARYFHDLLLNSPAGDRARQYLMQRGISLETAAVDFMLGYSPDSWNGLQQHLAKNSYHDGEMLAAGLLIENEAGKKHDRFRNKLMFPIADSQGRITGFGSRVLDSSMPKYINSPQTPLFDKSSSLYGINLAQPAIRQQKTAVLVEGYMDVIAAHQHGFTNVVAALGTAVTESQISILKKLGGNVVLAMDADAAGEEAMLRCVAYENRLKTELKVVVLPQGKDPDDVISEDAGVWQGLVADAVPVIDYTFDMVASGVDLTTASGKSLVVDRLLPIITEIKDDIRRDHYLAKLARLTETDYRSLERVLSRIKPDRKAREPKLEAMARALRPLRASPLEENFLALLLQHSELKAYCRGFLPEYLDDTYNREIFGAYMGSGDISPLDYEMDNALYERVEYLMARKLLDTNMERRCADYILRLQEKFLRSLELKKEQALASAMESGGSAAELARLEEQGIESSVQLGKLFAERVKMKAGAREVRKNDSGR